MQHRSDDSQVHDLVGTLHFTDIEGGMWTLVLDESHGELGEEVVVQSFPDTTPAEQIVDDSRVRARVRFAEAQFGIAMAGTYVDVLELDAAD